MARDHIRIRAHFFALFTIVVWGTTFIASKILLDAGFSTYEILILRFFIAYLILVVARPKPLPFKGIKQELPYILCGISGVTLYYLMEYTALLYTLTSNVGILVATAPFITAFAFWVHYNERPSWRFVVGFIIALVGIVLVSLGGRELGGRLLGDLLAIGAAVVWMFYNLNMREINTRQAQIEHKRDRADTLSITRRIFFWGIVSSFFVLPFYGISIELAAFTNPIVVLCVAFLAILGSAVCYVTWNMALRDLGELKSSIYLYAIPAVTCVASWLILGERLTAAAIVGLVLILAGLVLSQFATKPKQAAEPHDQQANPALADKNEA